MLPVDRLPQVRHAMKGRGAKIAKQLPRHPIGIGDEIGMRLKGGIDQPPPHPSPGSPARQPKP